MDLFVNGDRRSFDDVQTLADVLERLEVRTDQGGVAVAVNDDVIPKSRWRTAALKPDDRIEVIHAVQGG
jgi:sulfur carrier protein